ncbi:MAG TPA: hypothetical protein VMW27_06065, partial [Thermoanaerobaculia bacterium]|nr:hypothetical protein [Thermoanaerobaculia bacterium]
NVFSGEGFYLKRYVFADSESGGLTDGQYTMTNLNGQNGLVPLPTYVSSEMGLPDPPFQSVSETNYVMQVNAADPFDFMNFSAYTVPMLAPIH